ncbi:MAG: hypothetical protein MHM6MM_004168 [Cercozoa sp. M6MM]
MLSDWGLRHDGRKCDEARALRAELGVCLDADGSARFAMGQTECVATVSGPKEHRRRSEQLHDRATIRAEMMRMPFAGFERREVKSSDWQQQDMGRTLQETLESVVCADLFPKALIEVQVRVRQDDGGALACAINAACLALVDAGIPMTALVCGVTVGTQENDIVLDINGRERGQDCATLTVASTCHDNDDPAAHDQHIVRLVSVRQDGVLDRPQLAPCVRAALDGARQVHMFLRDMCRKHACQQLASRGVFDN